MLDDDGEMNVNAAAVAAYCLRHRKKRFDFDSNRQKQHRQSLPRSQTPFTNQPITSQTAAQTFSGAQTQQST
jgi:hypothetical protein